MHANNTPMAPSKYTAPLLDWSSVLVSSSIIIASSRSAKAGKENLDWTCWRPCWPICLPLYFSMIKSRMPSAHTSGSDGSKSPVSLFLTVSTGPPVLTAMTGTDAYMPSTGVIPKCSFDGVYSKSLAWSSKNVRWASLNEQRKTTWASAGTSAAALEGWIVNVCSPNSSVASWSNSSKYSTFSLTRLS